MTSEVDVLAEQMRFALERHHTRRRELVDEIAVIDHTIERIEAAHTALTEGEPCPTKIPTTTAAPTTSYTPATSAPSSTARGWIASLTTEEPETTDSSSTSPKSSPTPSTDGSPEDAPPATESSTPTTCSPTSTPDEDAESEVFASVRTSAAEKAARLAERHTRVAALARGAMDDGLNPHTVVAEALGIRIGSAMQYISQARLAGHTIPRSVVIKDPVEVRPIDDTLGGAVTVPTHLQIAVVANTAIAEGADPAEAIAAAFDRDRQRATVWLESCRVRGFINDRPSPP